MKNCLLKLADNIGFALVINDYQYSEQIQYLIDKADFYLLNKKNLGYGKAINKLVSKIRDLPDYIGILNQDLSWEKGTFEKLLAWLKLNKNVSLAVPKILNRQGEMQKLCKRNPTVLALLSRRFIPSCIKPKWLKKYDRWFVMDDFNYNDIFEVPYLSGCCMLVRTDAFNGVGGFDENYFLYLEDADLSRSLSQFGRCLHLPIAEVVHNWGRGNYEHINLMFINIHSALMYFSKWGWVFW